MNILLDLVEVGLRNSVMSVEDTGDLLKGRALGFRVDEVHPDKLDTDPQLLCS